MRFHRVVLSLSLFLSLLDLPLQEVEAGYLNASPFEILRPQMKREPVFAPREEGGSSVPWQRLECRQGRLFEYPRRRSDSSLRSTNCSRVKCLRV